MHMLPKKYFHISIYTILAVIVLSFVYFKVLKSPEDQGIKNQHSRKVADTAPLPEVKPHPKAISESEITESGKAVKPAENEPAEKSDNGDWQTTAKNALHSPDVSVRIEAIHKLWDNTTPEAVKLLSMFLDDKESAVAEEAIDALGNIALKSELSEEVLSILIDKATDKESLIRGPALMTAAMIGDQDHLLPVIGSIIEENNDSALDYAVRAIGFINGPETVPYLKKVLEKDIGRDLQRNVYTMLMYADSEDAVQIIEDATNSKDKEKQVNTVWALSRSNVSENTQILSNAVKANKLGDESLSIIASSRAAPMVFEDALQNGSLTSMDKRNLLRVISDNTRAASSDVRNQMAEVIKPLLNSNDVQVQKDAIDAIGKIGADNQAETLAPELESDSPILQGAALNAYAQYTTPSTYKPLIKLWYNEDEKIRRTAFFLSSIFLNDSDMEDLEKATENPDKFISDGSKAKIKQLAVDKSIKSQMGTGE
jgi:HEAT repeat protein